MAEKVTWTIYRPDKKSGKNIEELGTVLKPSNINIVSVSVHARKKLLNLLTQLIQFTDQQI